MSTIRVNLGPRSYDIAITSQTSLTVGAFTRSVLPNATAALVVADSNTLPHANTVVESLRSFLPATRLAVVPAGETSKSFPLAVELYDHLADIPADRNAVVVAVGGGVVGDLAGFAAATYNRGLALLMVPTTLLAMVDSAVGGKVGVNHPKGKNLIGAFHQPAGVWINTGFLDTLPEREYCSGLAEVVKYGVILDPQLFEYLEGNVAGLLARDANSVAHVVERSCQLKASVVERDEREETGLRAVLNYGHTFAHAFEAISAYGQWLHGEAVAAGMVCASRLAERLEMIPTEVTERQAKLLSAFGLPTAPFKVWPPQSLLDAMHRDKKAVGGRLRFVLPTRLGHVTLVEGVPAELVAEVLRP